MKALECGGANVYVVCTVGCGDSSRIHASCSRETNHAVVSTRRNHHRKGILPALSQDVQEVCCNVVTSAIASIDLKGRFQPTADISGQTTVKSSIQRGIRSAILSSWKIDAETLEEIWPKKESIVHVKWCVALILFRVVKEK